MAQLADPAVTAIITAYQAHAAAIRTRVLAAIAAFWAGLDDYRDTNADHFVRLVGPLAEGGQQATAAATAGYLAVLEASVTAARAATIQLDPTASSTQALRGVSTAELWRRPIIQLRTALAAGRPFPDAVQEGGRRAEQLAATNLQLAKTHAARQVMGGSDQIVGYRRSLTGGHSCGLCVVASTQRYHKHNLMPIHPGCDCGVIPIFGDVDPGRVIDPDRLEGVHQAIADRFGTSDPSVQASAYRQALVTHDHGEIGPVLAVRGQDFTGPADL